MHPSSLLFNSANFFLHDTGRTALRIRVPCVHRGHLHDDLAPRVPNPMRGQCAREHGSGECSIFSAGQLRESNLSVSALSCLFRRLCRVQEGVRIRSRPSLSRPLELQPASAETIQQIRRAMLLTLVPSFLHSVSARARALSTLLLTSSVSSVVNSML